MTSPTGSEHVSRYRAIGEFENLIREAKKAQRALRELREEEAKLNAQSIADDKKVAASKAERSRAEQTSANSAKKSIEDLGKNKASATKAGEDTGTAYSLGIGQGIQKSTQSGENKRFVAAATEALKGAFAKAGEDSGGMFQGGFGKSLKGSGGGTSPLSVTLAQKLRDMKAQAGGAGEDTGNRYIMGFASKIRNLNNILPLLGLDKLELDVDISDAQQSMKALEFQLKRLSNVTSEPRVRIDSTRALTNLRAIQKLFKDEVAEEIIKDSVRIQKELRILDELPSGRAFKFWALTALSDMSRVFKEADRGTSVFEKLRRAAASGGSGGNFMQSFISGFDDFSEASSKLLQRLSRISGELYRMPGVIGVLVSALPALIAGFGALVGGAGALASGLGALTGFLAAGPGLFLALGTGIASTATAFGGMTEVLKNARQAQDEEAQAKEQARLGTEKALTATQKYNLALSNLDPATAKVTEGIVKFSTKFAALQKIVGERFFKEVVNDMDSLNKTLPILERLLGSSAEAVGEITSQGIRMVTSGPWKRDFTIIAKDNATNIRNMGTAGLSLANAFRNITVAAGPFTRWVTGSIKEGAKSFSDWSAQARSDGTIKDFLNETRESGELLWQILKNLGNVINSFFQSTVDEGQSYLRTLDEITGRWADVAEAQEQANSPLRRWITDIRPVLTALGALIGELARGLGGLASDQASITTMINLLDTLRTRILPPIIEILRQLNESGIAVTVAEALGDMLDAIAKFLDSGATQALSVFVTVLANFFELLFNIASLPGVSNVLGTVAAGIAAIAAVSVVARFVGLFKLWDFFTWMTRNRANLSGAFADAARNAAGFGNVGGQQELPRNIPSTIANPPGARIGGVGSEVIAGQTREVNKLGDAATNSATKVGIFSRSLAGIGTAGNVAKGALSGLTGFLGGPWGVALVAATALIGIVSTSLLNQKKDVEDTKNAFTALKNAYSELSQGNTEGVSELAATDEKFRDITERAKELGLTLTDVSGALSNNDQSLSRVNSQLDTQIAAYEALRVAAFDAGGPTAAIPYKKLKDEAIEFKNSINDVANAQAKSNELTNNAVSISRTYEQRLGGMTQAQVDNAVQVGVLDGRINLLSNALDSLSSATSSASDRSRALRDIIEVESGAMITANEATETWKTRLFDLSDALEQNGRSLSVNSRAGLRNRDALQEAAKATRELYLQDIAAGVPMDKALKRHQDRIKELTKEADKADLSRKETRDLIKAYGDVPDDVKTKIDTTGYAKVYQQMQDLKALQASLQSGKSLSEATREVEEAKARAAAKGFGDGPGYATGGPVWGPGTRTSDSIRAWLSNGEFVQPTDAVEHYGMPIMEALRTRKLDKAALQEALPDGNMVNFSTGGPAHSQHCPSCASGGHRLASGGSVNWPFPVDASDSLIKKSWANVGGGIGNGSGAGGVGWMMSVLRKQFPGLPLISGYRPGSTTLSGNRSYHAAGRAVDLPPRRDVAAWIRANYGARTKELITPFQDLNLHNGKPHRYTGAIWNQHNFAGGNAHDHWAYRDGGLVDLMKMMNLNNLVPQQNSSLPATPRSLSPAASSVVTNNTESGTTFGDVIINNPVAERGGDSIRSALYRTKYLI